MSQAHDGPDEAIEVSEGKVRILVPPDPLATVRGPGSRSTAVFFNPAMEQNRDLSVLVSALELMRRDSKGVHPMTYLDGLSASGIRGIRMAVEADVGKDIRLLVRCNDRDAASYQRILENVERAGTPDITVTNSDLSVLLLEHSFDMVDVDPFGSPVPFLDAAVRAVRNGGILSVTATDTAALCGTSPRACIRKYGATPCRTPACHETSLRILIGHIQRVAAIHERAAIPLLSYSSDHFVRVYLRLRKGARRADEVLKGQGWIVFHTPENWSCVRHLSELVRAGNEEAACMAGPLWLGELHERTLLDGLQAIMDTGSWEYLGSLKSTRALVGKMKNELGLGPLYHATNSLARYFSVSPPSMERLERELTGRGHRFARCSLDPNGFRTDAPIEVLEEVYLYSGKGTNVPEGTNAPGGENP